MSRDDAARYSFRDSKIASVRLAEVARVFEPATRALLAAVFPEAEVVGIDQSDAFLEEARTAAYARCTFVRANVAAAPLPGGPADLVYARFVLSHLAERPAVLRAWFAALALQGVLVVEEVEWIRTDDDVFRTYLDVTSGLIARHGGALYTGPELAAAVPGLGGRVVRNLVTPFPVMTGDAATLFALNLQAWRDDPWVQERVDPDSLAASLAGCRAAQDRDTIRWGLRQIIVERA